MRQTLTMFISSTKPEILQIDDIRLFAGYVSSGTLTSSVHDAGEWASWGEISWEGTQPQGTEIVLQTRTGSVLTPDDSWSSWSDNYTNPDGEAITSPGAWYIQYRATIETENLSLTPELHEVCIAKPVADAGVRVAEDVGRVVVIFAEPSDNEHGPAASRNRYESLLVSDYKKYWDEVSYGAFAIKNVDLFDKGEDWYKLNKTTSDYRESTRIGDSDYHTYTKVGFVTDAIKAADADVDYSKYEIVVVVGADPNHELNLAYWWDGHWGILCWDQVKHDEVDITNIFFVPEYVGTSTWAHETGHGLGKLLAGERLPDLYEESPASAGDAGKWGLMDAHADWPVHLSSWNKARLGWLEYETVDWVGGGWTYWESWIDALPTLDYDDTVYSHRVIDWPVPIYDWEHIERGYVWFETDYIIEVRTENESYSSWDTGVPGTGLVLYQVDTSTSVAWPWQTWTWVDAVDGSPFTETSQRIPLEGGVYLRIVENMETTDTFQMRISARKESENQLWAIMRQVPIGLSENVALSSVTSPWPDLDLHAYTPDGKHVGVNYETGEYEIGIEGAFTSGDRFNCGEWIRLPAGVEAYFTVSSHDVEEFLTNNPDVQLELENGIYAIGFRYHDNVGERYESTPIGQIIEPGAEMSNPVSLVQNPDGTYSVGVELGWDMFNLEAWHFMIDNLPDNIFIKNPQQRKNALKEKFEEVFEKLDEAEEEMSENDLEEANGCYQEAAGKLANDVLKKLDADGQADWVTQPTLVYQIKALIAMLK